MNTADFNCLWCGSALSWAESIWCDDCEEKLELRNLTEQELDLVLQEKREEKRQQADRRRLSGL